MGQEKWKFYVEIHSPTRIMLEYELSLSGPGSSVGIATGWTVRGSNPAGGEIFRTCPDRPCGPLSVLYNGYWVIPGGKERPGCDADLALPSSAVVMKE
jgi:hypothetical protein